MTSPNPHRLTATNKILGLFDCKIVFSGSYIKDPRVHRHRLLSLGMFFAVLFGQSVVQTHADPRWYVSGSAGSVGFNDLNATDTDGFSSQLALDDGRLVSGAVGARIADYFRGELEVSRRKNRVDDFSFNNIDISGVSGSTATTAILANLYVDFLPDHKFRPYISGGVGVSRIQTDIAGPTTIFTNGTVSNDTATVFAWQLGLGASLAITNNFELTGGYRFFATEDFDMDTVTVGGLQGHEIMVGARFNF